VDQITVHINGCCENSHGFHVSALNVTGKISLQFFVHSVATVNVRCMMG